MGKKNKKTKHDADNLLESFRDKWSRGKLSLLSAHIFFAIDETRDLYGWKDIEDMDEAEKMFLELVADVEKFIPIVRDKPKFQNLEKELLTEEIEDEDLGSS